MCTQVPPPGLDRRRRLGTHYVPRRQCLGTHFGSFCTECYPSVHELTLSVILDLVYLYLFIHIVYI